MNRTKIEWVKNPDGTQGFTWNPITGCLNGCEYCYARKLANGWLKARYLANHYITDFQSGTDTEVLNGLLDPFYPRFWEDRFKEQFGDLLMGAMPKGIFVCDMSDLFGIGVPEEWTRRILEKISQPWYKEHRFYLLTKQPQNLAKFSPFPDNCWVGVTATEHISFSNALHYLMMLEAKVKYISFEPLLGRVFLDADMVKAVDWVIIGAQTCKSYWELVATYPNETDRIMKYGRVWTFQPKIEWVREIIEACDKARIPVFLKDNLKPLLDMDLSNTCSHYRLFTDDLFHLRQEFPIGHNREAV